VTENQGCRKQCEAAGAAISKGHLLLSHHFSERQYLLKLYCMDTRLLVGCGYYGLANFDINLNNFICFTVLIVKVQNKISKWTHIA
jgi:hypothetical protein